MCRRTSVGRAPSPERHPHSLYPRMWFCIFVMGSVSGCASRLRPAMAVGLHPSHTFAFFSILIHRRVAFLFLSLDAVCIFLFPIAFLSPRHTHTLICSTPQYLPISCGDLETTCFDMWLQRLPLCSSRVRRVLILRATHLECDSAISATHPEEHETPYRNPTAK